MEKLKIKIPLILPEVPDEKDRCVQRLIDLLQEREGLEKVHISPEKEEGVPELRFHYDPDVVTQAALYG